MACRRKLAVNSCHPFSAAPLYWDIPIFRFLNKSKPRHTKKVIKPVVYLHQYIKIQWLCRIVADGFRDQKTKPFLSKYVCILYLFKCSIWWTIFQRSSINHNIQPKAIFDILEWFRNHKIFPYHERVLWSISIIKTFSSSPSISIPSIYRELV